VSLWVDHDRLHLLNDRVFKGVVRLEGWEVDRYDEGERVVLHNELVHTVVRVDAAVVDARVA